METSIYRMRHCDILALCVLALLALGVVMVQSASSVVDAPRDIVHVKGKPDTDQPLDYSVEGAVKKTPDGIVVTEADGRVHQFVEEDVFRVERRADSIWQWSQRGTKHVTYVAVAVLTFWLIGRINYATLVPAACRFWRNPAVWALVVALGLNALLLVNIPGLTKEVNGARRWLMLGPIQLQPSELAKWATVLFLAWWLSARPLNLDRFWTGFVPTLLPVGAMCLLIVIEDFGTAALIGLCAVTMLLAGRVKGWHLAVVTPPALIGAFAFVRSEPYRWTRMTAFLDPWANPQGEGYHMVQSLLSFSTGGLFGRGLGNGVQKLGYLPEDTTDFIFAVICEELGIFGALLTIVLYLGIVYVAWQAVKPPKANPFGRLLAFGTASMLGLQAAINMAVATVSVPTKGLSLPLVSAGGSGLVITCAALALLYSVSRSMPDDESAEDACAAEEPASAAGVATPAVADPAIADPAINALATAFALSLAPTAPAPARPVRPVTQAMWAKWTT